jgi:hypothetical protein
MVLAGNLSASVIYDLNNRWYFPTGPNADDKAGTLTTATTDSLPTSFSTNLGDPTDNHFEALSTVNGSPFRLGVKNTTTIGQDTSSTPSAILSIASARIEDLGVTITGASGTGYLLPTFRVQGSLDVENSSVYAELDICAGNNTCILQSPAFDTGGFQNVDLLYTPAISSSTAFQFDTPFAFFFLMNADVIRTGADATAGGPVIGDFTNGLELISMQVVDANGQAIPGAQIHSDFLDIASVPEPAPAGPVVAAISLVMAGLLRRKAGRKSAQPGR